MAWSFVLDLLVASNMGMAIQHLGRVAGQPTWAALLVARTAICYVMKPDA